MKIIGLLIIAIALSFGIVFAVNMPSDVLTAFRMVENVSPMITVVDLSGTNPDVFGFPPFSNDKFVMSSSDRLGYYDYPNSIVAVTGLNKEGWPVDTLTWLGKPEQIPKSITG